MNDLHQELKAFIIETMNLEDVTPEDIGDDTLLFAENGLNLDSIDALELVLGLKKKYGITLEANDEQTRQSLKTVSSISAMVLAHRTKI
ncbi:MAG: acyl carrier protein [Dechloromonas sp.]|nr:acyl carrier protein [Dechloromonas sp.]